MTFSDCRIPSLIHRINESVFAPVDWAGVLDEFGQRLDDSAFVFGVQTAVRAGIADVLESARFDPHCLDIFQAEPVSLLLTGKSLPVIGRQLGISQETARAHLRRTFAKIGVSNQLDLVRLIASGPLGLSRSSVE